MNVPGPPDLRLVLAVDRLREASARVPVLAAAASVPPVAPAATEAGDTAPEALRVAFALAQGAAPRARATALPPPGEEAVDVSPRARLLSAIDQAGDTVGRATRALSGLETGGVAAALPAPAPGAPQALLALPGWVGDAVATLELAPPGRDHDAAAGHREDDDEAAAPVRGRLVAVLPNLGPVSIALALDGEAVSVAFAAAPEAGAAIAGAEDELAGSLAARGLRLDRQAVSHG